MTIIGAVDKLDTFMVQGWAVNVEHRQPVTIEVRIGDLTIKTLKPVLADSAWNGWIEGNLVGFRFFFTDELLGYVGRGQELSFVVEGRRLPIRKSRIRGNDNPLPLQALRDFLDGGGVVTKKGVLIKSIDTDREWQQRVLDHYQYGRTVFRRLFGKDLYLIGGALLGMTRAGDFIAGDDDVDTSYLSLESDVWGVRRELIQIAAKLVAAGEDVHIMEGQALIKWKRADGTLFEIFPSWIKDNSYYQVFGIGAPIASQVRRGFEERPFLGHQVLVPVETEAMLQAAYGPGWRTPDPHFQWVIPKHISRIMRDVTPNDSERAEIYWSRRYSQIDRAGEPSPFAEWVAASWLAPEIRGVIDLGCGDGRDTAAVAGGRPAVGLDYAPAAIALARGTIADGSTISFAQADLRDPQACLAATAQLTSRADGPLLLYSRGLLHWIGDWTEDRLRDYLRSVLPPGSLAAFEFRTHLDPPRERVFPDEYRRIIDPLAFIDRMTANRGLELVHQEAGRGRAATADEDPHVARVVFRRRN